MSAHGQWSDEEVTAIVLDEVSHKTSLTVYLYVYKQLA